MISNWGEVLVQYGLVTTKGKRVLDHLGKRMEIPGQLTIEDELYGQADCD